MAKKYKGVFGKCRGILWKYRRMIEKIESNNFQFQRKIPGFPKKRYYFDIKKMAFLYK